MKERRVCIFLVVALAFAIIPSVSANFACGEVGNVGNLTSSWFSVDVYYSQNTSAITTCKVSPEGGKYCCDPLQIKSVSWTIGKTLNARVNREGYFAGPVNLTISGEGYDVFPKMNLRRAVEIGNFTKVNINATRIEINISTASDFRNVSYVLRNLTNGIVAQESLCEDCNAAILILENFGYGQFELEVKAQNLEGLAVFEKINLWNFNYVNFERKIQCRRCKDNFVYSGENVNMTLRFRFSHEVDWKIGDAFPDSWSNAGNNGFMVFSDTHKLISWEVRGRDLQVSYQLQAPRTVFSRKFVFQTIFEDYSESDYVVLYRLYKFWPYPIRFLSDRPSSNYYLEFERISPTDAAVVNFDDSLLTMLVIFPSEEVEEAYLFVNKNPPIKKSNANFNFVVGSNIAKTEEILINYKIEKRSGRMIDELKFFKYDEQNQNWVELNSNRYFEDEEYEYFETYSDKDGFFAIEFNYRRING